MPDDPIGSAHPTGDDEPMLGLPEPAEGAILESSAFAFAAQSRAVIGRYRLIKELGESGFGVVWQATAKEPGSVLADRRQS
jgi:hypothetical protein